MPQLILASQSPRRRELLATAGLQFIVRSRPVAEIRAEGEPPIEYVRRLARAKAETAREAHEPTDEIVLGADTVVVLGDRVLEKPVDADDARGMLRALSGREHVVITGICLMHADEAIVDHESTRVHFVELTDGEIDAYVSSGEPMDKAGGYAIQGLASKFVDRIEGCYFNVMGLPLALVYRHWKEIVGQAIGPADGF
jgi:septum formation protein